MAHAIEEVEEMASVAGALVLNIGTLSRQWIDAMLLAGKAANAAGAPVVLDPVGVGATTFRTDTAKRILAEVDVGIVRGNAAEIAALAGLPAEIRGVEAIEVGTAAPTIARTAATGLGVVAAVTGPIDHVSDGTRTMAVANGDPLLATITGSGCIATAITGCFAAVRAERSSTPRVPSRVRRRRGCSKRCERPRHLPRAPLRRALRADAGVARPTSKHRRGVKLHCIIEDEEAAQVAAQGGATVIQLRVKGLSTLDLVERGRPVAAVAHKAGIPFVVNDDVEAAVALNAEGVHLGRADSGKELLGPSASCRIPASSYEAIAAAEQGADYVGAGPVWPTASKSDAAAPIGVDGLAAICEVVRVPVVAIGGVDAANAGDCIRAGAKGVAVVRASADPRGVRAAVDAAAF
jgi:thiamine-phosphate diphosphorylase